jgi:hypothetical protein
MQLHFPLSTPFFYNIKKFATGPLRFIAKMHLNTLYGYFGRKKTLIETKNVYKSELKNFYGFYTIFAEININEAISTILMSSNLDYNLINEINQDTGLELKNMVMLIIMIKHIQPFLGSKKIV